MKTSHLPWAKKEEAIKDIDVQNLFNDYWNSKEHKLKVLGQWRSLASPLISDRKAQRSSTSENIGAL